MGTERIMGFNASVPIVISRVNNSGGELLVILITVIKEHLHFMLAVF